MRDMKQMVGLLAVAGSLLAVGAARADVSGTPGSQDILAIIPECNIVDTYNQCANGRCLGALPSAEEAVKLLEPCIDVLSRKFASPLSGSTTTVNGVQTLDLQLALKDSDGIDMSELLLLGDLQTSIEKRGGKLLGYPVQVEQVSLGLGD